MKKLIFFSIFFFLSCKTLEKPEHIYHNGKIEWKKEKNSNAISYNHKTYILKKYQDYEFEEKFKKAVEESYLKTTNRLNIDFTYSIKPEGAVYPFSQVDIICITDKRLTPDRANEVCIDFFNNLDIEYKKMEVEIK